MTWLPSFLLYKYLPTTSSSSCAVVNVTKVNRRHRLSFNSESCYSGSDALLLLALPIWLANFFYFFYSFSCFAWQYHVQRNLLPPPFIILRVNNFIEEDLRIALLTEDQVGYSSYLCRRTATNWIKCIVSLCPVIH